MRRDVPVCRPLTETHHRTGLTGSANVRPDAERAVAPRSPATGSGCGMTRHRLTHDPPPLGMNSTAPGCRCSVAIGAGTTRRPIGLRETTATRPLRRLLRRGGHARNDALKEE